MYRIIHADLEACALVDQLWTDEVESRNILEGLTKDSGEDRKTSWKCMV
jgi:hypothetical protein